MLGGLRPNDSLRPVFDAVLGHRTSVVNVHGGDVRREDWTDGPIEVIFIDPARRFDGKDRGVLECARALPPLRDRTNRRGAVPGR